MNALHRTIEETLAAIREDHDASLHEREKLLAASDASNAELRLQNAALQAERDRWMRIATKLITELGSVESILAGVRQMAIEYGREVAAATTTVAERIEGGQQQ